MADVFVVDDPDLEFRARDETPGLHPLFRFLETPNVAEELDDEELGRIGQKVSREYEIDKQSRADWEEKMEKAFDLAMQVSEAKSYPWPNAANVKYPLITVAAIQFGARAYPAIIDGKRVVKGQVIGDDRGLPKEVDQETGEVTEWILPPGAKRSRADRIGTHMSWQLTEEMEDWEEDTDILLMALPIVGAAFRKSYFDPLLQRNVSEMVPAKDLVINYTANFSRCHRMTQHVEKYPHEITEKQRSGEWLEVDLGLPHNYDGDEDAPHLFLEQHRLLDLDEDGYPEPYIVTVHKESSKVVRIVPRYDEEGVEIRPDGTVVRIEPVRYYTRYVFMPSPDGGVYGLGFGILLGDISHTINTTINQLLDSGHLANTGAGFIGGGLRLKAADQRFRPGEFKKVQASHGSIRENVFQLAFPQPSNVMFSLLGLLIDAGKEIASVKDVLTGEAPKNAPATTTLALIEQGMKVFTAIYKRVHRSLKREFKLLYRLNRIYLQPELYFMVLDTQHAVHQADYALDDTDVVPVSDPNLVTDMQKMGKAQLLMELRQSDNQINGKAALDRILEAAGIENIEEIVLPQPPQDPKVVEAAARLENDRVRAEAGAMESEAKALMNQAMAEKLIAEIEQSDAEIDLGFYKAAIEDQKARAEARRNDREE